MRGEQTEDQFIGFRLKQGVYGQRQPDVQMIRDEAADGRDHAGADGDLRRRDRGLRAAEQGATSRPGRTSRSTTSRSRTPPSSSAASPTPGLSSREGCGNTVRNVTGDPFAGVTEGELFDITPYAGAYVRYFVRHPVTQLMPRKVKTAFTATDEDVAITGIHDIGFIPRVRDGVRGVEVRVGGGTSIMPRVAPTLYDFVELDNGDYLKVSEAVFRLFDRQEWLRVNRARARIKVLIDKIGIDAFREMVEEELEGDWVAERDFSIEHLLFVDDEEANAPPVPAQAGSPNGDRSEFDRFHESNVKATAPGRLLDGDGEGHPRRPHARADARAGADHARVQRRLCPHHRASEPGAALGPRRVGLRRLAAACRARPRRRRPGRDHRRRLLPRHRLAASWGSPPRWGSTGRSRSVSRRWTSPIRSRAASTSRCRGCPNGCSQHHIANIGFYGASLKVGDRQIPAYIPHLGGNYEGGEVVYGHRLKARLPAKRVPDAIERWLRLYESERDDGEAFNDFVERAGTDRFEAEVKHLTMPVEFGLETLDQFVDWSRSDPYKVERGEGECAV